MVRRIASRLSRPPTPYERRCDCSWFVRNGSGRTTKTKAGVHCAHPLCLRDVVRRRKLISSFSSQLFSSQLSLWPFSLLPRSTSFWMRMGPWTLAPASGPAVDTSDQQAPFSLFTYRKRLLILACFHINNNLQKIICQQKLSIFRTFRTQAKFTGVLRLVVNALIMSIVSCGSSVSRMSSKSAGRM
jgi:hypothetical protein